MKKYSLHNRKLQFNPKLPTFSFKAHASIHALHHRIHALKPYPGTFKKRFIVTYAIANFNAKCFFVKAVFITTGFLLSAYLYILSVRLENILVKMPY